MNKTRPRHFKRRLLALATLIVCGTALADAYDDARADMVAAFQQQDFAAMRVAAVRALDARPGYYSALFNLAIAQVMDGDSAASLATLQAILEQRVDPGAASIDAFAPLKALPTWSEYEQAVAELKRPVGGARIAYRHDIGDFVPEGIAMGPEGELYLGSIRHGNIIRLGGRPAMIGRAAGGGHWSVFGMRLIGDTLWFASSAIDQFAGARGDDPGRSGLFALDTTTGVYTTRALLPDTGGPQALGDLIFVDDKTILTADQVDGVIYRFSVATGEFETLVDRGTLMSPQGLVLDASGEFLYVADYLTGLYRVRMDDGSVSRIDATSPTNLQGIDGLYRYRDDLIAVQNGMQPNRVVRLTLSDDGSSVVADRILAMNLPEFDDPNLGEVVGDSFYFIANSHWPRFDRDNNLPEGLEGPIVLEISLDD